MSTTGPVQTNPPPPAENVVEVSTQVFEAFIQALEAEHAPAELVARLRHTLLEKRSLSEKALQTAVLEEKPLL